MGGGVGVQVSIIGRATAGKTDIAAFVDVAIAKGWIKPAAPTTQAPKLAKGQTRKAYILSLLTPGERKARLRAQKNASQNRIGQANIARGLTWEGNPRKRPSREA